MDIQTVKIEKPEAVNFILGQSHFIKTVEDIHEALVGAVPGIKFGLAFCEASGKCLIRWTGTDEAMTELAKKNAQAIGAGTFVHPVFRRGVLSHQRAEHRQKCAGGGAHLLRNSESD
jgi:adenosine/AMP kinase